MPLISVIVPIYKVEKYIDRCVESILAQSFAEFELILVDDGSPDSCPQICDEYAKKDSRISVIHKKNGGLSDARNAGIDVAEGEWLAFIDSDDYVHEDYLKTLYNAAIENDADLVVCDFVRVDEEDKSVEKTHVFPELVTDDKIKMFEHLNKTWRIRPAWNKLYNKSLFENLRFDFGKIHEDDFIIHHVLWNSRRIAVINDVLYYYLIRANSIMGSKNTKSELDGLEAAIEQCEFCKNNKLPLNEVMFYPEYLDTVLSMKINMKKQYRKRYRKLKKRFAKMYFSKKTNRNLKGFFKLYFNGIYKTLINKRL